MFCPFGPLPLTQSLRFHFPLLPNIPPYFQKFPQEFRSPLSPSFRFISTKSFVPHIGTSCTQIMFQSNQRWILGNWERFLSKTCQGRKTSFTFFTGVIVWEKCQEYRCLRRIKDTSASYLGKIKFSPSLVGQMICLMGKMITRHKDISNELSWAQFGVEEGIQRLTATTLFLEAALFGTF